MVTVTRTGNGDPLEFDVRVTAGGGETRHHVTMTRATAAELAGAGGHSPEQCLEAAFHFLLDREPKESIMGRFDVSVISRYFPEFARELPGYLARR